MPVVFVHGVATRAGSSYAGDVASRDALFKRYLFDVLGIDRSNDVANPYWGDHAARFRWDNASVPTEGAEAFGVGASFEDVMLAGYVDEDIGEPDRALLEVARTSPEDAFDLLWAMASDEADGPAIDRLADLAHQASRTLPTVSGEQLVAGANDDREVLDRLIALIEEGADTDSREIEAFGAHEVLDRLSEGLLRLRGSAGRLAGRGVTKLLRSKLHEKGAVFIGDVMAYLATRGDVDDPGPIVTPIVAAIERAVADDPATPLVVVAHSMGGNIAYDILSYYRPELQCDVFVTVGSQVGLFEELCLLEKGRRAGCPDAAKVGELDNLDRWINVFDYNDALGFAAAPVFEGAEDYAYSTGKGVVQAHTGYFRLPSFYRRLAARLGAQR